MDQFTKGKLISYCEFVQRGKPTAMMPIQDRYIEEAKSVINTYKLFAYIEDLSEGWKVVWIYKEKYLYLDLGKLLHHIQYICNDLCQVYHQYDT